MTKIQAKSPSPDAAPQPSRRTEKTGVPTMSDVAKLAGVSPMTVSRVMNGDPNVRPATRRKVDEAVAALNYAGSRARARSASASCTVTRRRATSANSSSAC